MTELLRTLRLDSARRKILGLAALAMLVPTLATTVVSYRARREALTERLVQGLGSASSEAARQTAQWLDARLYDLRVAAGSYLLSESVAKIPGGGGSQALGRLRDYLTSVRERFVDYEGLLVFDARGRVVTTSGRPGGVQLPLDRLTGLRTGDAVVGDAYWDAGMAKPAIAFAVPIRGADGRFLGALAAKVDLRSVADILARFSPAEPGDLYLMTDQGKLVMRARVSSAELMRTKLPAAATQALLDGEGTSAVYDRGDGQEVVGTLRRVPQIRWAAVAELTRAEIGRQLARLRNLTVLSTAALLAAVGLLASVLGLVIVRPLERLAVAAAKAAAGDHSVDLPVGASGEVGALAQTLRHLATRLREREGQGELERLSVTDPLTGLYNRRHLMGTLANEVQRSRRTKRTFAVLMLDADHFKQYNDAHGHLAGDAALVKIAEVLRQMTRAVDSVARYGGEEFVVMLLETTIAAAVTVGERIRARVAAEHFEAASMTVSVGAAEYPSDGDTPEELIERADAAMYYAKSQGRNRVVAASGLPERAPEKRRRRKGEV